MNNILALIYIFEESISMILLPEFSHLEIRNNLNEIRYSLRIFKKYVLIIWNFLTIGAIIFSFLIIEKLFGMYYANNGIIYLLITIFSLFRWALYNPYLKLLLVAKKLKLIIFFSSIELIFNIACWSLFIPKLNIIALRLGTYVTAFISIPIMGIFIKKYFSLKLLDRNSLLLIIFGFVFNSFYFLFFNIFDTDIISLIIKFLISIIFYTIFIIFCKIISLKEIKEVYKQITPKSMIDYFRTHV